jgi:hypothetical protein
MTATDRPLSTTTRGTTVGILSPWAALQKGRTCGTRSNAALESSNTKKRAFLAAFATAGGIRRASKLSKVDWRSHYHWLEADEDYKAAFEKARQLAGDFAEEEVYRRAFLGFDHPVTHQGEITTTYKDYSDTLAIFFLKGLKPERYRDNLNLSGSVGLPVDDFYNRIAERRLAEQQQQEKES